MSIKPLLSAILVASSRTFLSHAQTPMCASILPNFALLYPKYPNEVTPKYLSADCLASYLSILITLRAPLEFLVSQPLPDYDLYRFRHYPLPSLTYVPVKFRNPVNRGWAARAPYSFSREVLLQHDVGIKAIVS